MKFKHLHLKLNRINDDKKFPCTLRLQTNERTTYFLFLKNPDHSLPYLDLKPPVYQYCKFFNLFQRISLLRKCYFMFHLKCICICSSVHFHLNVFFKKNVQCVLKYVCYCISYLLNAFFKCLLQNWSLEIPV